MFKFLHLSTIVKTGIVVIILGILTIPCIVLNGVDYQQTDIRWTDVGSWFRTGPMKVMHCCSICKYAHWNSFFLLCV